MRRLVLLTATLLMLLVLTGIVFAKGTSESSAGKQITIKWDQWWVSDPVRGPIATWEAEQFHKMHPNVTVVPAAINAQRAAGKRI